MGNEHRITAYSYCYCYMACARVCRYKDIAVPIIYKYYTRIDIGRCMEG